MDTPSEIVIKIIGTTQTLDTNNEDLFTLYNLLIKFEGAERKVSRRFREFRTLNDALLREFAFTPLPAFPFNAFAEIFIGSNYLVSSRIFELEKWMNAVAAIPKVSKSHFFTLFLNLYDLTDKVAVVTGGNSGIGKEVALSLATNGCQVILACRSTQKAEEAAAFIRQKTGNKNVTSMPLDLASFSSIEKFIETFKQSFQKLDYLVNNAGIADPMGTALTKDGLNPIIGVNYVGTALLTCLLLETMSKEGKIVNVSSAAALHGLSSIRWGDSIRAPDEGTFQNLGSYSWSKLLLSAWTHVMAEKLRKTDISIFSIHPGTVGTNIFSALPEFIVWGLKKVIKHPDEGVAPILYCLLEPSLKQSNGHFFWEDCTNHDVALNQYIATSGIDFHATVWKETVGWLSGHFDFETCDLLH